MSKVFTFSTIVLAGIFPLFVVPLWAAAGAYKPWQGSFLWLALFAWICYFIAPESRAAGSRKERLFKLLRDPAFWAALGFVLFLLIQFINSNRIRIFDFEANQWSYSGPRYPNLPWSVTRSESREMLSWFVPVLSVLVILRHSWNGLSTRTLSSLVCLNAFLNALLAFIHTFAGWEKMYNVQQFGRDVYGSFGYPNHGASFFILMTALSVGLLVREALSESSERDRPLMLFSMVWAPIFFLGANLSTSRAGILGSWMVILFGIATILTVAWKRIHPVQRLYILLAGGAGVAAMVALFFIFAQPDHFLEVRRATVLLDPYREFYARYFQVETAWLMWKDYPWFGTGGWGYRYFVGNYLAQEHWNWLRSVGKANVHNDAMQFLAEFGIVGCGLLIGSFAPLLRGILQNLRRKPHDDRSLWSDPLKIFCLWGVLMIIAHSQIDLPFRSPAVFIHFVLLVMLLQPHPDSPSIWQPAIDWERLRPPMKDVKNRIWGIQPESEA